MSEPLTNMKPADDSASRVRDLFSQARDLPAGPARQAFLDQGCGEESRLRVEVESLLQADALAAGFLEANGASSPVGSLTEAPGTIIGRYRILELLGAGGFGEVYRAEQTEPVKREVALKVVKLGMDTKEVIARFEAERQALALMDHPNIARVFDAGATDRGRPYFVMELAPGIAITDYCRLNRLPIQQRLELFIQICAAVEHAHLKGVVHRDLKPSNMVITLLDGQPVPKVIDFGIAKSLDLTLTDREVSTCTQMVLGTPAHMSPEQAAGERATKASDLFGLGSVLYELLTEQPRFKHRVTLESVRRRLEQDEVHPRRLNPRLDTDLATICLKCLDRDPSRRYRSARALAEDLDRWLHGEPIAARPTHCGERLFRWGRRYPAAAGLIVSLTCGALVTTFLWREAASQREAKHFLASTMVGYVSDYLAERAEAGNPVIRVDAEATLCFSRSPAGYDPQASRLSLAVLSHGRPDRVWEDFVPLVLYLQRRMERHLGHPILLDLDLLQDDATVGAYVVTQQNFFAEVPLHVLLRHGSGLGRPQLLVRKESRKEYLGVLIAQRQAQIGSLADLVDGSFVFGDTDSALSWNGRAQLRSAGLTLASFAECVFLADQFAVRRGQTRPIHSPATGPNSRHAAAVEQVIRGTNQAGLTYQHCISRPHDTSSILILRQFPVIHGPWVGRVPDEMAEAFIHAMRDIKRNTYRDALGDDFERFVETSPQDYGRLVSALDFGPELDGHETPQTASPKVVSAGRESQLEGTGPLLNGRQP